MTGFFSVRVPESRCSFAEDSLQRLICWISSDVDSERGSPKGCIFDVCACTPGHRGVLRGLRCQVGILLPMSDESLDITGKYSEDEL